MGARPGSGAVVAAYRDHVESGKLTSDAAQLEAAEALDSLAAALKAKEKPGGLSRLFGRKPDKAPRGLYIHGAVGRGKTFLMDLFVDAVEEPRKRRLHFHEFMDEVHTGIAAFRRESGDKAGRRDPIPAVAGPIAETTRLLCLDEFHVSDITDAMLLQRLFSALFEAGVVLVATSNLAPDRLYENGLNRQLFTPFIALLKERCRVIELDAAKDYRRDKLERQPVYFFGPQSETHDELDAAWRVIAGPDGGEPETLRINGRDIKVPAQGLGAARFSFAELCEAPLGARDYLRLSQHFHTLVVEGVPHLDRTRSDAAKRFILLIDTLYDRGIKLVASFEAPLDELGADSRTSFEFQRTVSRLTEMQSGAYLAGHGADAIAG